MRVFHVRCLNCNFQQFDVEGFGEERTIRSQDFHALHTGHTVDLKIEDIKEHQKEFEK